MFISAFLFTWCWNFCVISWKLVTLSKRILAQESRTLGLDLAPLALWSWQWDRQSLSTVPDPIVGSQFHLPNDWMNDLSDVQCSQMCIVGSDPLPWVLGSDVQKWKRWLLLLEVALLSIYFKSRLPKLKSSDKEQKNV